MSISLKEMVINLIKQSDIDLDSIIAIEHIPVISEDSLSPILAFTFKMYNGEKRQLNTSMTRELIHDLNTQGKSLKDDMESLDKFFKRKLSLNQLLGND